MLKVFLTSTTPRSPLGLPSGGLALWFLNEQPVGVDVDFGSRRNFNLALTLTNSFGCQRQSPGIQSTSIYRIVTVDSPVFSEEFQLH